MKPVLPLLLAAFIVSPFIGGHTPAGLCAAPAAAADVASAPAPDEPGCNACTCTTETAADTPAAPAGHPLRGVVQNVMTERSALLVKHEEIPGVMRAMTMLLNVTPADLAKATTSDTITATLYRDADDKWWLRDVTVVPAS